jgi:hypothetical protein
LNFFLTATRSSIMYQVFETYYRQLASINGNDLVNHYTDVWTPGGSGFWGAIESLAQLPGSPPQKYLALEDLIACPVVTSQSPGPRSRRVVHYHHVAGT